MDWPPLLDYMHAAAQLSVHWMNCNWNMPLILQLHRHISSDNGCIHTPKPTNSSSRPSLPQASLMGENKGLDFRLWPKGLSYFKLDKAVSTRLTWCFATLVCGLQESDNYTGKPHNSTPPPSYPPQIPCRDFQIYKYYWRGIKIIQFLIHSL